jgi:hypothetical protein
MALERGAVDSWLRNAGDDMIERMATLQLTCPIGSKRRPRARAAAAGYDSVDSYIASLIEADEVAPISDDTEAELLRGLDSGPLVPVTREFLDDLKKRARAGRGNAA